MVVVYTNLIMNNSSLANISSKALMHSGWLTVIDVLVKPAMPDIFVISTVFPTFTCQLTSSDNYVSLKLGD